MDGARPETGPKPPRLLACPALGRQPAAGPSTWHQGPCTPRNRPGGGAARGDSPAGQPCGGSLGSSEPGPAAGVQFVSARVTVLRTKAWAWVGGRIALAPCRRREKEAGRDPLITSRRRPGPSQPCSPIRCHGLRLADRPGAGMNTYQCCFALFFNIVVWANGAVWRLDRQKGVGRTVPGAAVLGGARARALLGW